MTEIDPTDGGYNKYRNSEWGEATLAAWRAGGDTRPHSDRELAGLDQEPHLPAAKPGDFPETMLT